MLWKRTQNVNAANYVSYSKRMRQYELASKAISYSHLVQLYVEPGSDFNVLFFQSFSFGVVLKVS